MKLLKDSTSTRPFKGIANYNGACTIARYNCGAIKLPDSSSTDPVLFPSRIILGSIEMLEKYQASIVDMDFISIKAESN